MPLSDTPRRYGRVTRTLHWVTVLVLAVVVPLGLAASSTADRIPDSRGAAQADLVTRAVELFSMHKTLGLTALALTVLRILWVREQHRPRLLPAHHRAEAWLARGVHLTLYAALVLAPLTGWLCHAASEGFAPILWPFGQTLPLVPQDPALARSFAGMHVAVLLLLGIAVTLHLAGVLKHQLIHRDATLRRMLTGAEAEGDPDQPGARLPGAAAALLCLAVLAAGYAWRGDTATTPLTGLQPAGRSQWQVTGGRIGLTVTQFGREIEGGFTDWTAEIAWDPMGEPGPAGKAVIRIATASLDLGAVTLQATGPDFLDTEAHPVATLVADLSRVMDGQRAEGTLTLKGTEVPVAFPFWLTIEAGTAYAGGMVELDRRDFAIGDNLADDSALAFPVTVRFELQADRSD